MNKVNVEVAYATPKEQRIISIAIQSGSTIEAAIKHSGILDLFPEINLVQQKVGVFGKVRDLSTVVNAGDRIEIYRQLTINPKEARRVRAKAKTKKHP